MTESRNHSRPLAPSHRSTLLAAQRTAALRHDDDLQATLLPLLLRNYLEHGLYEQADRLVSKTQFPEGTAQNNQLARWYYYLGEFGTGRSRGGRKARDGRYLTTLDLPDPQRRSDPRDPARLHRRARVLVASDPPRSFRLCGRSRLFPARAQAARPRQLAHGRDPRTQSV